MSILVFWKTSFVLLRSLLSILKRSFRQQRRSFFLKRAPDWRLLRRRMVAYEWTDQTNTIILYIIHRTLCKGSYMYSICVVWMGLLTFFPWKGGGGAIEDLRYTLSTRAYVRREKYNVCDRLTCITAAFFEWLLNCLYLLWHSWQHSLLKSVKLVKTTPSSNLTQTYKDTSHGLKKKKRKKAWLRRLQPHRLS